MAPGEHRTVESPVWYIPNVPSGMYQVHYSLRTTAGLVLAKIEREIAVNSLSQSILIFCAHEDDEMAHAGTIRAAVENNIPIHLIYFTSGDAGSCDRYYGRFCGPNEAREFGYVRMQEARKAMNYLGVPSQNIYFLGLPDGGSAEIWYNHIEPTHPYLSILTATENAPYKGLFKLNLPYARKSVVNQVKHLIRRFQPQIIYTGHPNERHVDHRTNNWFVIKALNELLQEEAVSRTVRVRVDQAYGPRKQNLAPYNYEKHTLYVSGEAAAFCQEAAWYYQSQSGNQREGQRQNFDDLPREEFHLEILDWYEHEGWNE